MLVHLSPTPAAEASDDRSPTLVSPFTSAELAAEAQGLRTANRRTRWLLRRMDRLAGRAVAAAAAAERLAAEAEYVDRRRYVVGSRRPHWIRFTTTATTGFAVTLREARRDAARLNAQIDEETLLGASVHLHTRSRLVVLIAYALLLVDAVALFSAFAYLLNIDFADVDWSRLVTAAAFSLLGAGVMAKLAVELGRRVWAWRVSNALGDAGAGEFPPRSAVVAAGSVTLSTLSVLSGVSIFVRIVSEGSFADSAGLAATVGLVLAVAATAAPWILVQQEAYDGSPATRRLAGLTRVDAQAEAERIAARRSAVARLAAARRALGAAQRLGWLIVQRVGGCFVGPHQLILLAQSVCGRETVPAAGAISVAAEPVAVLPISTPPDLRRVANAMTQMRVAVERAAERIERLDAGEHLPARSSAT